ncbi:site-specific DNA-methyltransferase [Ostreibacterium oceani]|uniref:site-specific DNA-methyltransferase (adenine-specific) n=1 Tax=Ostreibacterium oceani TaxID=2654998 RepID=A0A6N7EU45_9GAMM|nr:site-specific DNA-methyltransferase [Ostreibacterium oceani]MPV86071.1 site-specific DNA-methyltransferase [Ostreibacterium oceani]
MDTDKLDLKSPDLVNKNFEKLADLFPNCVTESAEGKAIDFDLLKQELSHAVVQGNKERYRLEWPGKREAIVTANLPTTKTLRPVREDSVNFDNTENLYIEGDNLEVLKLLQESYLGKIKMIYIDPPYNTGKDFVYQDNFSKDAQEELIESGQKDEYNQRLVANPETAGRYHSDWLSMMYPRLKLARNLLDKDGAIFISIDDNEVDSLEKICKDIFGEINFVSKLVWKKRVSPANDSQWFSSDHEYLVVFAKDKETWYPNRLERSEKQNSYYKNPDNDPNGPWNSAAYTCNKNKDERPNLYYPLINPTTGEEVWPRETAVWAYSKETHAQHVKEGRLYWGADGKSKSPRKKQYLTEAKKVVQRSVLDYTEVGSTQSATLDFLQLFDHNYFTYTKPVDLIKRIITLTTDAEKGDVVLDFFSGSGSTAHAVISKNAEDSGNRKCIQVQLPELLEEKTQAYKDGYRNICEIAKERIRRAAKKIKEETKADIDYGFRVYRLDESNMQDVYYKPQDYDQGNLDLFADNVKSDRSADDLLAQVMLDWGLPLSLKIEQVDVSGKKVFKVAENSLYACFDSGIDEDFAKAITKDEPLRIVFKDSGFKNDTAKTNVKQLLKQLSPETEMKVI